ncbi:HD domain-containing protein [Massilia sp. CF038]|uniref:HD domain-containing protein n=1 Tax=Massilia sp. CF038 TaxID=1881045 RepID=UPI00091F24BE|nr:HD domain-containing protein [Massilia sp. CF038]SHG46183.1 HD domain-containing protein [Massilia sp. CF038]
MKSGIDAYADAWEFVTARHAGQTYGGRGQGEKVPYINHLASVAAEVAWGIAGAAGWDLDLAVQCALLHDVMEDTHTTVDEVSERFGPAVAAGVLALTKNMALPTGEEKMRDTLARIRQQPKEVWAVKLADRISNLYHPPFYWTSEKKRQYTVEAQVILDALGAANSKLAERLAAKIATYPVD